MISFKGAHFSKDVILYAVFFYVRYGVSYRDLEEIIEEETQSNRFSIHRLAHYCLDLAELMETDRVIPVVIFLNSGTRQDSLRLGGDRHSYLEFRYLASCDLKRLSASDYKDSTNIIMRRNTLTLLRPTRYESVFRLIKC